MAAATSSCAIPSARSAVSARRRQRRASACARPSSRCALRAQPFRSHGPLRGHRRASSSAISLALTAAAKAESAAALALTAARSASAAAAFLSATATATAASLPLRPWPLSPRPVRFRCVLVRYRRGLGRFRCVLVRYRRDLVRFRYDLVRFRRGRCRHVLVRFRYGLGPLPPRPCPLPPRSCPLPPASLSASAAALANSAAFLSASACAWPLPSASVFFGFGKSVSPAAATRRERKDQTKYQHQSKPYVPPWCSQAAPCLARNTKHLGISCGCQALSRVSAE